MMLTIDRDRHGAKGLTSNQRLATISDDQYRAPMTLRASPSEIVMPTPEVTATTVTPGRNSWTRYGCCGLDA